MRLFLLFVALVGVCVQGAHRYAGTAGTIRLQDHVRISHDTYYLGEHDHAPSGQRVHGYAFLNLHRSTLVERRSSGMPRPQKALHFNRTVRAQTLPGIRCTAPIADGAAWQEMAGYRLHVVNRHSLSQEFLVDAMAAADDQWRCALNKYRRLVGGPLIEAVAASSGAVIDLSSPDGRNDIGFAGIEGRPGTLAVTIVWGIFSGPQAARRIVEFDMVFDGVHYNWGDATRQRNVVDVQSIATHEMGHRYGLDDVYEGLCNDATMFGTSAEGETKKRTLHPTDVAGLSELYGST